MNDLPPDEELDLLADLFLDAHLDLDEAILHTTTPTELREGVVRYLRLATAIARHVSGIDSAAWGGCFQC